MSFCLLPRGRRGPRTEDRVVRQFLDWNHCQLLQLTSVGRQIKLHWTMCCYRCVKQGSDLAHCR
eukprot:10698329-Karenia_brevis.AAC.1